MDHTGLGQQERMRRFLLVVDTGPDDLEASLSLKLDNAHVKSFIKDDGCRRGNIGRGDDLGDTLVQRTFEDGFGCAIGGVCGGEP